MKLFGLLIFILIFVNSACSNKGETANTEFKIYLSNLVSQSEVAGGVSYVVFKKEGDPFFADLLLSEFSGEVPFGEVNIFLVAYSGPDAWKGIKYCGLLATEVTADTERLSLDLSSANCALNEEYKLIMNLKEGSTATAAGDTFGSAIFGTSTFAP